MHGGDDSIDIFSCTFEDSESHVLMLFLLSASLLHLLPRNSQPPCMLSWHAAEQPSASQRQFSRMQLVLLFRKCSAFIVLVRRCLFDLFLKKHLFYSGYQLPMALIIDHTNAYTTTPPSQRSPVMLDSQPPNINRRSSPQTVFTPNSSFTRPISYFTRHRRSPSTKPTIGQTASHDTQPELAPPGIAENAKDDVKTMASKGALSQVRDQFALFQKAKSKWPNPEASIGKFCGKKGKYSCWESEGIAQDAFKEMSLHISTLLLNRTCGPVPAAPYQPLARSSTTCS